MGQRGAESGVAYGVARFETSLAIYSETQRSVYMARRCTHGAREEGRRMATHHVDTAVPRNRNDRLEGPEIDTWMAEAQGQHGEQPTKQEAQSLGLDS